MKFSELMESFYDILFECILNEETYTFYKTYDNVSKKRIMINFICAMFKEHSVADKGIEFI